MILPWLTLILVALLVLALAGYLVLTLVALIGARRNVSRLADRLEAVAGDVAPLDRKVEALAAALTRVRAGFAHTDDHFAAAERAFHR